MAAPRRGRASNSVGGHRSVRQRGGASIGNVDERLLREKTQVRLEPKTGTKEWLGGPQGQLALQLGRAAGKRALGIVWERLATPGGAAGRYALVADQRGEAQVTSPGPHWVKIAPRCQVKVVPVGPAFTDLCPAFQADPSIPKGAIRMIYSADGVFVQNHTDRPVSVFLLFLRQDTVESLALLAQSTRKVPPWTPK